MAILWRWNSLGVADNIIDFPNDNNNSISFKFKEKMKVQTANDGTRCWNNGSWRTLEISLIVKLIWS